MMRNYPCRSPKQSPRLQTANPKKEALRLIPYRTSSVACSQNSSITVIAQQIARESTTCTPPHHTTPHSQQPTKNLTTTLKTLISYLRIPTSSHLHTLGNIYIQENTHNYPLFPYYDTRVPTQKLCFITFLQENTYFTMNMSIIDNTKLVNIG